MWDERYYIDISKNMKYREAKRLQNSSEEEEIGGGVIWIVLKINVEIFRSAPLAMG